jgi:hypothetical protein
MRIKHLARWTGVGAVTLAATVLTMPAWAQAGQSAPSAVTVAS